MALKAQFYKHTLNFTFDAGTSRGVLRNKDSYFIKIFEESIPEVFGIGEAGPLFGLSPEFGNKAELKLREVCEQINIGIFEFNPEEYKDYSSVLFAIELAFKDLENKGEKIIFQNDFTSKKSPIPINGLIWMDTKENMRKQVLEKIHDGFTTIKLKIGAIDFKEELDLLKFIRNEFKEENLVLRVDANGAFALTEALEKLHQLFEYNLHSIEQPIKAGQWQEMASLCEKSPIPIALDEELIDNLSNRNVLLSEIKPQFIILKPSLMGGFMGTREWIKEADGIGINWWITSALESNIGLNGICQFTAEFNNDLPQGLGTGKLYANNFSSPLKVKNGYISYDGIWDLSYFNLPNS